MGNQTGLDFIKTNLRKDEVEGKRVLEAGSFVVNFSPRPIFESLGASSYVGIDIAKGPGVDIVCNAEDILDRFGNGYFDILVSMELLEHVHHWQKVISNFKKVLKPNGIVLIGTRSRGFDYHGYPYDFWRFTLEDMKSIFSDFSIQSLVNDPACPGLFLKAVKPLDFQEQSLFAYRLYSIVSRRRVSSIGVIEKVLVRTFYPAMLLFKRILRLLLPKWARVLIRHNILTRLQ